MSLQESDCSPKANSTSKSMIEEEGHLDDCCFVPGAHSQSFGWNKFGVSHFHPCQVDSKT